MAEITGEEISLEEKRRLQIINAAMRLISEKGIKNITMTDIAEAAEFSKGGVNHYFKSKDELIVTTFREFFDRFFKRCWDSIKDMDDPLEKILSFVWLLNFDDPDVQIGYPLLFEFMSLAIYNAEYSLMYKEWVDNWAAIHRECLAEGIEKGIFKIDDIEETARSLMSIYFGFCMNWYQSKGSYAYDCAESSIKEVITKFLGKFK